MADEGDVSVENEQRALDLALQNQRTTAPQIQLQPKGCCHFCDEITKPGHTFCDQDCRDDYDYERRQRRRHYVN